MPAFDLNSSTLWLELTRRLAIASEGLERLGRIVSGGRPALTLLCVMERRFIRADMDNHGHLLDGIKYLPIECDAIADLPKAVDAALKDGLRPGRRLWILHDGLPSQLVTVPSAQLAGLSNVQIGQALLFELEQLGGGATQNQQSSQMELRQSDGQAEFWTVHAPKTLIAQLRRTARQFSSRFAGLLHPCGLSSGLSLEAGENGWARLEIWPDAIMGLHKDRDGNAKVWMLPSGAKPKRIQSEIERWIGMLGGKYRLETLGDGVAIDLMPEESTPVDLEDEQVLGKWLSGWGNLLARGASAPVPILAAPEDPNREIWLMAGFAAAAMAVCLLHAGLMTYREHQLEKDKGFFRMNETRRQGLEVEVERIQKQRDEYKSKLEPLMSGRAATTPELVAALRRRFASLLREISDSVTDGVVVEELHTKANEIILKGVSLNAADANGLAVELSSRLKGMGWSIQPPRKKDLVMDAGGGPWEFEIPLADMGMAGFTSSAPNSKAGR